MRHRTKNRASRQAPADFRNDEDGVIIVLFALILVVAVGIIAMVIDHSKQSLSLNTIQRAADIAALTSAKRLNGKLEGWYDAKTAAIISVKQNPIHGVRADEVQELLLDQGIAQWPEPESPHTGSEGSAGGLHVRVERGVLWWDHTITRRNGEEGGYRFISLEESPQWNGVNTYLYASAVRVSVTVQSLNTSDFGKLFGTDSYDNLTRVAIAVSDQEMQVPVLPLAIPYCELLMNTDPSPEAPRLDLEYQPHEQCQRELVFTEANPKDNLIDVIAGTVDYARRGGLHRFESYIRRPYKYFSGNSICFPNGAESWAISCMHLPMYGTLGVPAGRPGLTASFHEVAESFRKRPNSALGMYFAPLDSLKGFATDAGARQKIAAAINEGTGGTIRSNFTIPIGNNEWRAARNFPFIRTHTPDCGLFDREDSGTGGEPHRTCFPNWSRDRDYNLRLVKPLHSGTSEPWDIRINVDKQNTRSPRITRFPGHYTNPLCHDANIDIDNVDAPVLSGLAMVVAPGVTRRDGRTVTYCDFENVFNSTAQESYALIKETRPTVIGYIPVKIFDFNLADLDAMFPANHPRPRGYSFNPARTATPTYSFASRHVTDRSPGELDLLSYKPDVPPFLQGGKYDSNAYTVKHKDWRECEEMNRERSKTGRPLLDCNKPSAQAAKDGIPAELLRCFDFGPLMRALNELDRAGVPEGRFSNQLYNVIFDFWENNIPALPGTHCVPVLLPGKYDKNDPDSYDDLGPVPAGFGCGGIRARLDCGDSRQDTRNGITFATGGFWEDQSPALVSEDISR